MPWAVKDRILDHDGTQEEEGGIEAWLQLGEAVGLTREEIVEVIMQTGPYAGFPGALNALVIADDVLNWFMQTTSLTTNFPQSGKRNTI